MPKPLTYNKNFDKLSYEEKKLLAENKKSIEEFVEHSSALNNVDHATRNVHAKTYAVLHGVLMINQYMTEDLKKIFDTNQYRIVVRLSNAQPKISGNKKDFPAFGFAVKIKDDTDRTIANFPLVNFPLFPIDSVSDFLTLFTALNRFYIKKWKNLFMLCQSILRVIPCFFKPEFLRKIFSLTAHRNDFILSFSYHSVGVFRFGDYMVKIKINPKNTDRSYAKNLSTKEAAVSFLINEDYSADVEFQFCCDLKKQPVNILSREWKDTPFVKIGEIYIAKNSLMNTSACENELLSFNPFENAEIFQPVGKIQKLRDEAYKISLKTRKKINKLLKYQ